ncbi:MAG: hypothetical protein GF411_11170 [Candidatus Lokiarchaeota archaeon]|nr:hypothetical protein [Candidatus Lokiarchaeota archaeon]
MFVSKLFPLLVVFLIVGGVALPLVGYSLSRWDMSSSNLEGTVVTDSSFSNFTSDTRYSAIYPNAFKIESQRPFLVTRDFQTFDFIVDNESALSTATNFLQDVGPPFVNWTIQAILKVDIPPSWKILYNHVDFTAYVVVDAIEGQVIEYESRYLHEYDPTDITLLEAETIVSEFLTDYNIEIPFTARYIEGFPYDCRRFYSLVFQEYNGPIEIETSSIIVRASSFTHGISYYHYDWIGLDPIDTTHVVGQQLALSNALSIYEFPSEQNNLSLQTPKIALADVEDADGNHHLRLSWVLDFESEIENIRFYVDAFSGNLFGIREEFEPYRAVQEHILIGSTSFLLGLPIISVVSTIGVSSIYLWKRYSE